MNHRSSSPPLPTFGVRDISGPLNPPGFVSITRSQYASTIQSQPDAKLLYLDDDDGELITIGSSLELSQRLDDPVPKYGQGYYKELRNPLDGQLVHVFDIKHSSGSLTEWRHHEAYSSKQLRLQSSRSNSFVEGDLRAQTPLGLPIESRLGAAFTDKDISASYGESDNVVFDGSKSAAEQEEKSESKEEEKLVFDHVNILDGIEEHLNGLATVLQLAASTLQKAANKTRKTDTSVVEDILEGVKGILTEVGAFGVEAFKELRRQSETDPDDLDGQHREIRAVAPTPAHSTLLNHAADMTNHIDEYHRGGSDQLHTNVRKEAMQCSKKFDEENRQDTTKCSQLPTLSETVVSDPEEIVFSEASSKESSRVKFAFVEDDSSDECHRSAALGSSSTSRSIAFDGDSTSVEDKEKGKSLLDEDTPLRLRYPPISTDIRPQRTSRISILDDSSEDAEFTARYPPLRSVRRARSNIEPAWARHVDSERSRVSYQPYRRFPTRKWAAEEAAKAAETKEDAARNVAGPLMSEATLFSRPPFPFKSAKDLVEPEGFEATPKPLPGAWPDLKNEPSPALPISGESSGAFFNRMTGRDRDNHGNVAGLHRANTTASSNPASRLNGPFDPGFPYEPTPRSSYRPQSFLAYRPPHCRSASPSRDPIGPFEAARARRAERMKDMPKLDTKRSVPNLSRGYRPPFGRDNMPSLSSTATANPVGHSKFESHHAVRHHRSVPQFNRFVPPPPSTPPFNYSMPPPAPAPLFPRRSLVQPLPPHGPIRLADTSSPAPAPLPDFLSGPTSSMPPPMHFTTGSTYIRPQPQAPQTTSLGRNALPSSLTPCSYPVNPFATPPHHSSSSTHFVAPSFPTPVAGRTEPIFESSGINQHPSSPPSAMSRLSSDNDEPYWRVEPLNGQVDNIEEAARQASGKLNECIEALKMCGFGLDDDNLKERLHVYAIAADGNVNEAVEMIEEDRRMSRRSFD